MELERHEDVLVLRLNQGRANAMNPAFTLALERALDDVETEDPPALVLTGDGRHFCAGLDLVTLDVLRPSEMDVFLEGFERVLMRLFLLPRPVVAAVNGNAIAGGCILALAADHRTAARGDYRIGVNEARIGVSFPSAALEIPRFQLTPRALHQAVLEGDLHGVEAARALGLVDELVAPEELAPSAILAARRLSRSPRAAFARVKRELRDPIAERVAAHGAKSRDAFRDLWFTDEARRLRAAVLKRGK